ncbi:uncharacterized protein LOC116146659 [Pistacia vera]|uniref:uncharacterized protein LOC116146659 n=1 Tax=Pistacia vera TaxID=55513 RepID=UPI001262B0CB|nr:uncharacterized protein LOC116146659 [Pistacia vera]
MSAMRETLIQAMKNSISLPPDMQLNLSEGKVMSIKEVLFWILLDEVFVEIYFKLNPENNNRKAELVRWLRSKFPERPTKNCRDIWYDVLNWSSYGGQRTLKAAVNKESHKVKMTEDEYNLWKDMDEELKDVIIQIIPEKAEVVARLRSEAREGKVKAASPASQEHTNLKTGGGSSTAQNEALLNHRFLVGGDHQVHNLQDNGYMSQTVNYAPGSSDMESGTLSTQADNESAEHTNPQTGGGSSTAQNEASPNHQGLPAVKVNGSINQTFNYTSESSDIESGTFSTQADNEPAPDRCGHETLFMVLGEIISIALAVTSVKKSEGEMPIEAKIFLYILIVCILVGIISLSYGLCLSGGGGRGRRSIVVRVVNAVSYVAIGLAVVTAAGLQLPNQVMVWVIPFVWCIIAPAIVCYAMKQ